MALRYHIQLDNDKLWRGAELKVVPRYGAAERVEFRPGGDLKAIVDRFLGNDRTELTAAPGAGKSVKVPEVIVRATKGLVVHCVPNPILAYSLWRYVSKVVSVDTHYVTHEVEDLPLKGIAFMGSSEMMRRMLEWTHAGKADREFLFFLDESHESDCYTSVLRELGNALPGVRTMVLSSATFDPTGAKKAEPAGMRIDHYLPQDDITDWDPEDDNKPWSVANLDGDAMIFVERGDVLDKLHTSYADNGFLVHRLTSRMTIEEYEKVATVLEKRNRPVVVMLADYSFRSGFTCSTLRHLLDSGEVKYYGDYNGSPARMYRKAFRAELHQAANRASRTPGSVAHVWSPREAEDKICDVEGTEIDAAALLFRLLGFKPPRQYASSCMYDGDVPEDIAEAMVGMRPLYALREDQMVPFVGGRRHKVVVPVECEPVAQPVPRRLSLPKFAMTIGPDGVKRSFKAEPREVPIPRRTPSIERIEMRPRPVVVEQHDAEYEAMLLRRKASYEAINKNAPAMWAAAEQREQAEREAAIREQAKVVRRVSPIVMEEVRAVQPIVTEQLVASPVESFSPNDFVGKAQAMNGLFDQAVVAAVGETARGNVEVGDYCYFPGIETVGEPDKIFRGGVEAIHRMVSKRTVVDGWSYDERLAAMRLLVDEYNECIVRHNAAARVAGSTKELTGAFRALVDPGVFREWVLDMSERASQDRAMAKTIYADFGLVFASGMVPATVKLREQMALSEVEYVRAYMRQLEVAVVEWDVDGPDKYAGISASAVRDKLAHRPPLLAMGESEGRSRHDHRRVLMPASTREIATAMSGASGRSGTERVVAKYKLQPSSGLPSMVARAMYKVLGEGDVKLLT